MDYNQYKDTLKKLKLSSVEFMKVVEMNQKTPATNWRRQDRVPKVVEVLLETLWKLPEDERVLFIHHKLKEVESGDKRENG